MRSFSGHRGGRPYQHYAYCYLRASGCHTNLSIPVTEPRFHAGTGMNAIDEHPLLSKPCAVVSNTLASAFSLERLRAYSIPYLAYPKP